MHSRGFPVVKCVGLHGCSKVRQDLVEIREHGVGRIVIAGVSGWGICDLGVIRHDPVLGLAYLSYLSRNRVSSCHTSVTPRLIASAGFLAPSSLVATRATLSITSSRSRVSISSCRSLWRTTSAITASHRLIKEVRASYRNGTVAPGGGDLLDQFDPPARAVVRAIRRRQPWGLWKFCTDPLPWRAV